MIMTLYIMTYKCLCQYNYYTCIIDTPLYDVNTFYCMIVFT